VFFVRSKSVALLWPFGIMGGLVLVFAAVSVEIGLPIVWFGAPFPTLRATDVLPLLVPPILVGSAISAFAVCFRLCKDLWQKMLSPN
jgi:hypothetical protein